MMNSASGKSGFRGFASKLRDQAKDVVGNYKLPTFDDMAKNDEYIHSPDFNVRGSSNSGKRSMRQEEEMNAEHSIVTNGTSLNGNADEASNYSTESSWSLLDRPSSTIPGLLSSRKTSALTTSVESAVQNRNDNEARYHSPQQNGNNNDWNEAIESSSVPRGVFEESKEVVRPSIVSNTKSQSAKKPSGSLLSVVSDALQSTTPLPVVTSAAVAAAPEDYDGDNDSDQSSEIFDEEDPVFSKIRKSNDVNNNDKDDVKRNEKKGGSDDAPASVIMIKKSSNRFMEDLRLQANVECDQHADIMENRHLSKRETENEVKAGNNGGLFGGSFKITVIQNLKQIVLRRGSNDQAAAQRQRPLPPLARERTPKPELDQGDDFQITASTSVGMLADEDLERLKQLKMAGESSSPLSSLSIIQRNMQMIIEYLREHRHFVFVAFTLLLSIIVYFRRARTSNMF